MKKYLCFDIGGLSLKYSIYDQELKEYHSGVKKYKLPERKYVFELIKEIYSDLAKQWEVVGICISSSGIINNKLKKLYYLDFKKGMFAEELNGLMEWCQIPWYIENDANCALLAEMAFGNAKNYKNIALFTIGTALGGAIAIDQKLYRGSHFLANEIGCGVLNELSLDENISRKTGMNGLTETYNKINNTNFEGIDIIEKGIAGETMALEIIDQTINNLAKVIFNAVWILDPELVLIGGGISANQWFINKLIAAIKNISQIMKVPFLAEIKTCHFNNNAGKIGALTLGEEKWKNKL